MPSSSGSRIHFYFKKPIRLPHRKALKVFIETTFSKKKINFIGLNIIFCSDRELLKINQDYLGHDYFTDIITFNYGGKGGVEGEIYISVDRIRENARTFEIPLNSELHRVIFHGVLHLCGHKDKTEKEKKAMTGLEDRLLATYF